MSYKLLPRMVQWECTRCKREEVLPEALGIPYGWTILTKKFQEYEYELCSECREDFATFLINK